jgi:hypothetical protein
MTICFFTVSTSSLLSLLCGPLLTFLMRKILLNLKTCGDVAKYFMGAIPLLFEMSQVNLKSPCFHVQKVASSILGLKSCMRAFKKVLLCENPNHLRWSRSQDTEINDIISASTPTQVWHKNVLRSHYKTFLNIFEHHLRPNIDRSTFCT